MLKERSDKLVTCINCSKLCTLKEKDKIKQLNHLKILLASQIHFGCDFGNKLLAKNKIY